MTNSVRLGEIIQLRKGKKASEVHERHVNGAKPYIQIDEVRGALPQKYAVDAKGVVVAPDDLCIVWDGANAGTVGYGVAGLIGSTVARMRLTSPETWDTDFVGRLLQSKFRQLNDAAQARGATIPHVDKSKLEAIELPRIERSEQQRIAAILEIADSIRRKREQALTMTDRLLRATFLNLFGDPVRNPKDWKRVPIGDVCSRVTVGIVVKPASYYVDEGVPALRSLNVREGRINRENFVYFSELDNKTKLKKTRVWAGDVVAVRSGQPGKAAIIPEDLDGANAIDILIATPRKNVITSDFLCDFLNSPGGRQLVLSEERGQIQKHLNVKSLKECLIPLPPAEFLDEYSMAVQKIKTAKERLDFGLQQAEGLFASLSQRAFRGEL